MTFSLISLVIIVALFILLGSYVLSMIKYIAKFFSDRFTNIVSGKNTVDTTDTLYDLCTSEAPYSHPIIAKLRHEIDVIKHGFPDRSKEIPIFKSLAFEAWKKHDWVVARTYFFKLVESLKQQNHRCNGAHETEWREAQKAYSEFAKSDPLVNSVIESARSIIASNPGMTQAKIYPLLKNFKKEDVQYGLYFGEEQGKINRIKKGRSYILSFDQRE